MERLSRRYLDVLDVLEEYVLLRELLTRMDDAYACGAIAKGRVRQSHSLWR